MKAWNCRFQASHTVLEDVTFSLARNAEIITEEVAGSRFFMKCKLKSKDALSRMHWMTRQHSIIKVPHIMLRYPFFRVCFVT